MSQHSPRIAASCAPFLHTDLNRIAARFSPQLPADFQEYLSNTLSSFAPVTGTEHPVLLRWSFSPLGGLPFGPVRITRIEADDRIWPLRQFPIVHRGPFQVDPSQSRRLWWTAGIRARFGDDWVDGMHVAVVRVEGSNPTGTLRAIDLGGRVFPDAAIPVRGPGLYVLIGPSIFGVHATGSFEIPLVRGLSANVNRLKEQGFHKSIRIGAAGLPGPPQWCGFHGYEPIVNRDGPAAVKDQARIESVIRSDSYSPEALLAGFDPISLDNPELNLPRVLESEIVKHALARLPEIFADPKLCAEFLLESDEGGVSQQTRTTLGLSNAIELVASSDAAAAAILGHGFVDVAAYFIDKQLVSPALHPEIDRDPYFAGPFSLGARGIPQAWPIYVTEGRVWDPEFGKPTPGDFASGQLVQTAVHLERPPAQLGTLLAKESGGSLGRMLPKAIDLPYRTTVTLGLTGLPPHPAGWFVRRESEDSSTWINERFELQGREVLNPYLPSVSTDSVGVGRHELFDHGVTLQSDQDTKTAYEAWSRDRFGRVQGPLKDELTMPPPDVGSPDLKRVSVEYNEDQSADLIIEFGWEWTHRSPVEIRFAGEFTSRPNPEIPFSPLDLNAGFEFPSLVDSVDVRAVFDGDDALKPKLFVGVDQLPDESVTRVDPPRDSDDPIADPTDSADQIIQRHYQARLPLGSAASLFATQSTRYFRVAADALETVSGPRRSAFPSPTRACRFSDPRTPVQPAPKANFVWAAFPDNAGKSRATIEWQPSTGPAVSGYRIFSATEDALVEALQSHAPTLTSSLAAIAKVSSPRARANTLVQMFEMHKNAVANGKPFVERVLEFLTLEAEHVPASRTTSEIQLRGDLDRMQLYLVTAYSKTGVDSNRLEDPKILFVAVPRPPKIKKPKFRVLTEDVSGSLAVMGSALLFVGTERITDQDTIVLLEGMGGEKDDVLLTPVADAALLASDDVDFHLGQANALDSIRQEMAVEQIACFRYQPAPSWKPRVFSAEVVAEGTSGPQRLFRSPPAERIISEVVPISIPSLRRSIIETLPNGTIRATGEISGLPTQTFREQPSTIVVEVRVAVEPPADADPGAPTDQRALFVPAQLDGNETTLAGTSEAFGIQLTGKVSVNTAGDAPTLVELFLSPKSDSPEILHVSISMIDPTGRRSEAELFPNQT